MVGSNTPLQELTRRIITAAVLCAVLFMVLYLGTLTAFMAVLVVASLSLREWCGLCSCWPNQHRLVALVLACAAATAVWGEIMADGARVYLGAFVAMQCFFAYIVWVYARHGFKGLDRYNVSMWVQGVLLIVLSARSVLLSVLKSEWLTLYIIALVAISDIAGFVCGKLLGKGRPFPVLSPNKTWAGTVAMCLAPFAMGMLIQHAVGQWWYSPAWLLSIGPLALHGDLWVSLIKRYKSVKHTGEALPGHGGWLDRIDSHVMVFAWLAVCY